ncbi:hypothetical protein AX15_005866 [Amanita polypyramis BW_CC]|nr:hypothetical protein AX15_005866 [Amanita polypyramis BW_CC]
MDAPDPLLEAEPDFSGDPFHQTRADLTALNIPEDTITNCIRQTWIASRQIRHDAWAEDCQRRRRSEPPQDGPPQDGPPQDGPPQDEPPHRNSIQSKKAKAFPVGITVPEAESPRPSEYARQKITKSEYIELWYFSREGLAEASMPTTSTSNDTFGLVTGDLGAIQLCPVATTKASKNALPDESLSWDQISITSKVYVDTLRKGQWPDQHVWALVKFFSELDYQRTQFTSIPDRVFIKYQATVRRQWMDSYDFDISEFSLPRLHAIQTRVTMHAHQAALGGIPTKSASVEPSPYGMVRNQLDAAKTTKANSLIPTGGPSASTGSAPQVVTAAATPNNISAQAVGPLSMEPNGALWHNLLTRRNKALTPYTPGHWHSELITSGLLARYPTIPTSLVYGFEAGIPRILQTFIPPNHPSSSTHNDIFVDMIKLELEKGRYIGPLSRQQVEMELGPFQTSPISIIPKPGQPNKYRIIQNLSYPRHSPISSVNAAIDTEAFPCAWGTFGAVCAIIDSLPPGSEAAVRDVAEAYRTVPLAASHWPAVVVRLPFGEDSFAIDTCLCFGLASSAGVHGIIGDAGADLMRAQGIGPLVKWVDDHLFFRLNRGHINTYNTFRLKQSKTIVRQGGQMQCGARLWFPGETWPDGRQEEWPEDLQFPLRNFPHRVPGQEHAYTMDDIDEYSAYLGIPWQRSKDLPFSTTTTYLGFIWDLNARTVALSDSKKDKYSNALNEWRERRTHTLNELEQLHGKLLHASLVIPQGRAYITGLEAMFPMFHNELFKPRTPPRAVKHDLVWWASHLLSTPPLPIPSKEEFSDVEAFSDASNTGIAITIGPLWRAWALDPSWRADGRDIGWAEAIAFEILIHTVTQRFPSLKRLRFFCDNRGVVEGWWKGDSTTWSGAWESRSAPNMSRRLITQQMDHLEASTPHGTSSSHPSKSVRPSAPFSPTPSWAQAAWTRTASLPPPAPPLSQVAQTTIARQDTTTMTNSSSLRLSKRAAVLANVGISDVEENSGTLPPLTNEHHRFQPPLDSSLRPQCLAKERLQWWCPTSSRAPLDNLGQPQPLTQSMLDRVEAVLQTAWAPSTAETYGTGLAAFHWFCDRADIAEEDRAPASRELLEVFASALAGVYSPSTISNYLAGIRAWHIIHGLDLNAHKPTMDALLKAAIIMSPPDAKRAKRPPLRLDKITSIKSLLDLDKPLDSAVFACLTTTFWGTARLGEFTLPDKIHFDLAIHIARDAVSQVTDREGNTAWVFRVPRTKTEITGEDIYWAPQPSSAADPLQALQNHFHVNNPLPNGHLFAYRHGSAYHPLRKKKFLTHINGLLSRAKQEMVQGHSIRIGSTLEYLLRGLSFEALKVKGRWSSDAYTKYLRAHAEIMAPFIQENANLREELVQRTIPPIRRAGNSRRAL